jgi:hypothetical protein
MYLYNLELNFYIYKINLFLDDFEVKFYTFKTKQKYKEIFIIFIIFFLEIIIKYYMCMHIMKFYVKYSHGFFLLRGSFCM